MTYVRFYLLHLHQSQIPLAQTFDQSGAARAAAGRCGDEIYPDNGRTDRRRRQAVFYGRRFWSYRNVHAAAWSQPIKHLSHATAWRTQSNHFLHAAARRISRHKELFSTPRRGENELIGSAAGGFELAIGWVERESNTLHYIT